MGMSSIVVLPNCIRRSPRSNSSDLSFRPPSNAGSAATRIAATAKIVPPTSIARTIPVARTPSTMAARPLP